MLRFGGRGAATEIKKMQDHFLMSSEKRLLNKRGMSEEGLPFCGRGNVA